MHSEPRDYQRTRGGGERTVALRSCAGRTSVPALQTSHASVPTRAASINVTSPDELLRAERAHDSPRRFARPARMHCPLRGTQMRTQRRPQTRTLLFALLAIGCAGGPTSSRDTDESRLLALHAQLLEAHRSGNADPILDVDADDYVVANRGEITRPAAAQRRQRLTALLASTRFTEYTDVVPPIVSVSRDGTLGRPSPGRLQCLPPFHRRATIPGPDVSRAGARSFAGARRNASPAATRWRAHDDRFVARVPLGGIAPDNARSPRGRAFVGGSAPLGAGAGGA